MPLPTNITLPIDCQPVWPSYCIRCGRDAPDTIFRFRPWAAKLEQILAHHFSLGWHLKVEVPACSHCAAALCLARWTRSLTALPLAILESALIYALLGWLGWPPPGPYSSLIRLGSVFLCGVVIHIVGLFFPPTIDVRSERDNLVYEFRDPTYAEDFEVLNGFDPSQTHTE